MANIFITGVSSGIGKATAERLLDAGHRVVGGSRRQTRFASPLGHWVPLDVTDPASIVATAALAADGTLTAALGPRRLTATVVASGDKRHVFVAGRGHVLSHVDLLGIAGAEHDEEGAGLLAPMPGKVIALLAKPGAAVEKGAPLLVLEAMKMEHTISAPRAGTVKGFRYAAGDQVAEGAELVEFD